ncbi:hypothetical protein ABL78_1230 [Leptomonas seymouri]|uniref:Leucine-rich repeat protein n=1 Tax=Leptomonas seymouri TaxID=5684 RepID=A0A0N0P881_LEPSE|nr:hypothetical protein ABL78_1230 [Leptomonas seymouri]|eukprot:KPI89649.1 hypothetical protein ABL78_1230 [Leptomonas seymouri]
MSDPILTPEELNYYASLELADPDDEALDKFLHDGPPSPSPHEGQRASKPSMPSPSSSSSSIPSPAAATRRRLSISALTSSTAALTRPTSASTAITGVHTLHGNRCGVTDVLDKSDLVGGIAGMADAALQTRLIELPGRGLSSISSIHCFLNATHLYLQHNVISSLDGLEMLSRLQVLVVHHNMLTSVEPLRRLERLFYLDVSDNKMEALPTLLEHELPCESLQYLNLKGNPFHRSLAALPTSEGSAAHDVYVATVCAACPKLECLDDVQLSSDADEETSEAAATTDEEGERQRGVANDAANARNSSVGGGGCSNSTTRRVQGIVEAARAAAQARHNPGKDGNGNASSRTTISSSTKEGEVPGDARGQTVSAVSAVLTSTHATPLEVEEERLLQQLLRRTPGESASALTTDNNEGPNAPPQSRSETDELSSRNSVADALQLYQSLQYTQRVSQARQQRDITAHWDDVSRVLQTAQALQQDRRRRIHERLQEDAPCYTETLQLLQKESYTSDLDRYRKAEGPLPRRGQPPPPPPPAPAGTTSPVAVPAPASGAKHPANVQATTSKAAAAKPNAKCLPRGGAKRPKYVPKPPPSGR